MSVSSKIYDPLKDPLVAEHRGNLERLILTLARKVRQGPPIKISKYGFSHTLNQEDFDDMDASFKDWIGSLDWIEVEELASLAKSMKW